MPQKRKYTRKTTKAQGKQGQTSKAQAYIAPARDSFHAGLSQLDSLISRIEKVQSTGDARINEVLKRAAPLAGACTPPTPQYNSQSIHKIIAQTGDALRTQRKKHEDLIAQLKLLAPTSQDFRVLASELETSAHQLIEARAGFLTLMESV